MKTLIAGLTVIAIAAWAQPALADRARATPPAPSSSHTRPHQNAPRVYGTPIQPPIFKKVRKPRGGAHQVRTVDDTAKRKARASAARKARANEEYRRAHPASSDPPR